MKPESAIDLIEILRIDCAASGKTNIIYRQYGGIWIDGYYLVFNIILKYIKEDFMKTYVVGVINFFDNELRYKNFGQLAQWSRSSLLSYDSWVRIPDCPPALV